MTPRASVIVLTHDRAVLLEKSVGSVLDQTVDDLEVLILGDGVTDAVRASATRLAARDRRVRFLDYPKGEHRGETNRDRAIHEAASNAIFYLCDDDLFMPTHVESLLELLETHTFVQSLNCWIDSEGLIHPYPGDLATQRTIDWHLRDDLRYNAVSITGTAHRRDFYLDAAEPWAPTPAGQWPDHWQWRKLMRQPTFSGATSLHATALQFPFLESEREGWTEQQRADELDHWLEIARSPSGQETVDSLYTRGVVDFAETVNFYLFDAADFQKQVLSSRSWRLTKPLRWLTRVGRRLKP